MGKAKASLVATLGIGMIVIAGSIGCGGASTAPAAAAPASAGAPASGKPASMMDSDNDGVMDDVDMCPNEKEDGKGSAPGDGCPDGKGASAKSA
ncbi:MAG: hypothetical protein ABSE49_09045 [Polyangiaceae bacterium]|jgi:hypothetical protein